MAIACRDQDLRPARLSNASGQKDANARRSALKLCEWGVLRRVPPEGEDYVLRLARRWLHPVEEAALRAGRGKVEQGQTLLLIARAAAAPFYRLLANRDRPDPRISWVLRLPHHDTYALIVFVNPRLAEDELERLAIELEEADVVHERLFTGQSAGHAELREFAASSLPGAFGPGV